MLLFSGFFYFVFPISPKASLLALLCGECSPKQLSKREVLSSVLNKSTNLGFGVQTNRDLTQKIKSRDGFVMSSAQCTACVALKLWQCCDITKALSSETCCFVLFHPFTFFYLLAPVTLASAAESLVSVVLMCKAKASWYRIKTPLNYLHFISEHVAVKIINKSRLDSKTQKMVQREMKIMDSLSHPNLIRSVQTTLKMGWDVGLVVRRVGYLLRGLGSKSSTQQFFCILIFVQSQRSQKKNSGGK